jgi:hypothetical protein
MAADEHHHHHHDQHHHPRPSRQAVDNAMFHRWYEVSDLLGVMGEGEVRYCAVNVGMAYDSIEEGGEHCGRREGLRLKASLSSVQCSNHPLHTVYRLRLSMLSTYYLAFACLCCQLDLSPPDHQVSSNPGLLCPFFFNLPIYPRTCISRVRSKQFSSSDPLLLSLVFH